MSAESARLFVALELPAAATASLAQWRDEQLAPIDGLRPVPDTAMHVTLCFLGSRPLAAAESIARACAAVASAPGPARPIMLSLGDVVWLPSCRPSAVAVRLGDVGGDDVGDGNRDGDADKDGDRDGDADKAGDGDADKDRGGDADKDRGGDADKDGDGDGDGDGRLAKLQSRLARALQDGGWYEPERRPFLAHVTLARVARGARVRPVELPAPPPMPFAATLLTLFRSWTGSSGARYERLASVRLGQR